MFTPYRSYHAQSSHYKYPTLMYKLESVLVPGKALKSGREVIGVGRPHQVCDFTFSHTSYFTFFGLNTYF